MPGENPREFRRGEKIKDLRTPLSELRNYSLRLRGDVDLLKDQIARLTRGTFVNDRHPFELYLPKLLYKVATDDRAAILDTHWRSFYVRHGYCNLIKTAGCDDADGEGTTPELITVPDETGEYYVWNEITLDAASDVVSAIIKHGPYIDGALYYHTAALADWVDFPKRSTDDTKVFRALALIETTEGAPAYVRQYQRTDIFLDGVGGGGGLPSWV